jgi:hypothetical protein
MCSTFLESEKVIEFRTTHAYCNLGTTEKYKINKKIKNSQKHESNIMNYTQKLNGL